MLGSGTSSGVPRIGEDWGRCDPANPRNRRRRVSILLEHGETRLLVDTGPDLREQLLDAGVGWLTAVLYTHDHADHCHGIDDLRPLFHAKGAEIDCYMDQATRASLRTRFSYVFAGRAGYPPTARAHLLTSEMRFGEIRVTPFLQQHGPVHSMGYRFEAGGRAIAYSTDVSQLPEEAWQHLRNLDLWIVDALRRAPHPTHSHLAQTLQWIERAKPAEAWLTHMDQSMDHAELIEELPAGVSPGWDGRIWEDGG
ncbi:MBL fold metallo-hydrolase [Sandaracinobacter sp. RS1-74]|uniref:MBL fold metallo-hydrolase n=1 Tax=Sandaracinobacteroides sayramensis TaxID=2913411 RepID=UPI001EDAC923|nr:MBL fold metallo-hydrolase [Sandaracinobacteroides sayramensis]MCG2840056.1 MBL fold metallo-hydrolase [Sandaracinobacteroides sayramensis]